MSWGDILHQVRNSLGKSLSPNAAADPSLLPSQAKIRYTPPASVNSRTSSSTTLRSSNAGSSQSAPGISTGPQLQHGGASTKPQTASLCVVFGVREWHGFDNIENIETRTDLQDNSFFHDLRLRHKKNRGALKRWFSPFRFRFCKFVQVSASINKALQ